MKKKPIKVESVDALRKILKDGSFKDFAIVLAGGACFSRKEICLSATPTGRERFHIMNCIDDSMQWLNAKQLLDKSYTNIGEAMKKGAFYQIIY